MEKVVKNFFANSKNRYLKRNMVNSNCSFGHDNTNRKSRKMVGA